MGNLLYSADILRTEMLFKKEDKDNILNTLDFNILAESGDPFSTSSPRLITLFSCHHET